MSIKSLIINPGSTSTKIGVFEDETLLFEETLRHSTEEIASYATIVDQRDFRKDIIVCCRQGRHVKTDCFRHLRGKRCAACRP